MSLLEEFFDELDAEQDELNEVVLPIFGFDSDKVKDNKDHFPLGNEKQARSALAQANKYKRKPRWFAGTLGELKESVVSAVKREYPSIEVTD